MQEDEFLACVGSLISCCNPNWEVIPLIFEPSYDGLSLLHQSFDLTLKSIRAAAKKGLFAKIVSRFGSKISPEMFQSHLEIGLVNDIK